MRGITRKPPVQYRTDRRRKHSTSSTLTAKCCEGRAPTHLEYFHCTSSYVHMDDKLIMITSRKNDADRVENNVQCRAPNWSLRNHNVSYSDTSCTYISRAYRDFVLDQEKLNWKTSHPKCQYAVDNQVAALLLQKRFVPQEWLTLEVDLEQEDGATLFKIQVIIPWKPMNMTLYTVPAKSHWVQKPPSQVVALSRPFILTCTVVIF